MSLWKGGMDMEIHTKGGQCEDKVRTSCEHGDGHPQAKEKGTDPSLIALRRHQTDDPWSLTSSLQNHGATHFCCFESHSQGYLFRAGLASSYMDLTGKLREFTWILNTVPFPHQPGKDFGPCCCSDDQKRQLCLGLQRRNLRSIYQHLAWEMEWNDLRIVVSIPFWSLSPGFGFSHL